MCGCCVDMTLLGLLFCHYYFDMVPTVTVRCVPVHANCVRPLREMQPVAPRKTAVPVAKATNVPVRDGPFHHCNMPDFSPAACVTLNVQRLTCAGVLWI